MSSESNIAKVGGKIARNLKGRPVVAPPVDIYENAEAFTVVADIPGVFENDVNIRLDRGEMWIEATRDVQDEGTVLGRECRPVDYRRSFILPENIQAEGVNATLKNGVLTVKIPKSAEAMPRKISVKGV